MPKRNRIAKVTRRDLAIAVGSSALAGGVGLALGFWRGELGERYKKRLPPRLQPFSPNAFLAMDQSGAVTIWVTKSEMGQGVRTSLPMILAEELEADWRSVRIEQALASRSYGDQSTHSSESVASMFDELRRAGASAKEMLVAAAARQWSVSAQSCFAESGHVIERATGRRIAYGRLAGLAARMPVPEEPRLKRPEEFTLLGRSLPRLDIPEKVDGRAGFGLDVRLPSMLFASIARCPVLGGKRKSFDADSVLRLPGVRDVFPVSGGVAVVAENSWAALSARRVLAVEWEAGDGAELDNEAIAKELDRALSSKPATARREGKANGAAARAVEAVYDAPYLAHAAMEPLNATAWVSEGKCEIWAPTQNPHNAKEIGIELTGFAQPDVVVHTTLLGGGFGRRSANVEVRDAVEVALRTKVPVQVVWSREDDVQHDRFRAVSRHRLRGELSRGGEPLSWTHTIASPSMLGRKSPDSVDPLMVSGARELPYAFPSIDVGWTSANLAVPLGFWRSVGHSYNAYATECFVDELAVAAERDPVAFRRELLAASPRHLAVLERAAARAGWGEPLAAGRARGVAVHACFGSYCAMVAEVSIEDDRPRVHRVVAAVDCGLYINPDIIRAQIEGGIAFGLAAALHGRIDLEGGAVVQSNFHDYRMLRIGEMPEVSVELIGSSRDPGGVGELGVPAIAPAVCNALFALRGQPVRRLPITLA